MHLHVQFQSISSVWNRSNKSIIGDVLCCSTKSRCRRVYIYVTCNYTHKYGGHLNSECYFDPDHILCSWFLFCLCFVTTTFESLVFLPAATRQWENLRRYRRSTTLLRADPGLESLNFGPCSDSVSPRHGAWWRCFLQTPSLRIQAYWCRLRLWIWTRKCLVQNGRVGAMQPPAYVIWGSNRHVPDNFLPWRNLQFEHWCHRPKVESCYV